MADDLVKRLHKWVDDLEHDCDYNLQFELSGEEAGDFAEDISGALTRIAKLEAALRKFANCVCESNCDEKSGQVCQLWACRKALEGKDD
jgi:hypothetical protein